MARQGNKEIFLGGLRKLFEEQWQVDVLLKAGNSDECASISAHKLVLASRSMVLKKMMESDELKSSPKLETVTFSEMRQEELEALVEFMYSVDGSISSQSLKKHVLVFAMATQNNKEIFLSGLRKLFKEQWQPDVLLKAGNSDKGATISAHKLVLASRSVVLKKIMESDEFKASSKLETVTFSEMKHEELEALVEFMYCVDGSICLESLKKHVGSLYLAADKYEIPHLRDLCRNQLKSSLNSSNALNTFELAQIPFDKALNDAAFTTIKNNINTIANSAEFKLFVVNNPYLSVEIMKAFLVQPNSYCCGCCGKYRF
ncbi:unnamed protein product [Brassica rapa subsp. narinosa]